MPNLSCIDINLSIDERFYIWLLLTRVPRVKKYKLLRTVSNTMYLIFKAEFLEKELLNNDPKIFQKGGDFCKGSKFSICLSKFIHPWKYNGPFFSIR